MTKTKATPLAKTAKAVPMSSPGKAPEAETDAAADGGATLVLRKKEFLERIHVETGARKKDVREIVEATLKHLGEALANGETLALSPLGKLRVNRQVDKADAEMLIVKIRRDVAKPAKKVEESAAEGLAETED